MDTDIYLTTYLGAKNAVNNNKNTLLNALHLFNAHHATVYILINIYIENNDLCNKIYNGYLCSSHSITRVRDIIKF